MLAKIQTLLHTWLCDLVAKIELGYGFCCEDYKYFNCARPPKYGIIPSNLLKLRSLQEKQKGVYNYKSELNIEQVMTQNVNY